MTLLTATFDPATAAVVLVVDGAEWSDPVDAITITRQVAGESDIAVRGVDRRRVVGGFFAGSDHEMPLETTVTYRLDGLVDGAVVESTSETVSTGPVASGLWVKVPGKPDLTVRVPFRSISDIASPTIGGVYQIAGGGGQVSQTSAQWSGIEGERATIEVSPRRGVQVALLRAALTAGRVLLLQPAPDADLDPGWYYVADVARGNPGRFTGFDFRIFALSVTRTTVPAGDGQGVPGVSWASLAEQFETWQDVIDSSQTWFEITQGVWE